MCKGPVAGEPAVFPRLEEHPACPGHGEERGKWHEMMLEEEDPLSEG